MKSISSDNILENYINWWGGHVCQTRQVHEQFLEMRQAGLRALAGSMTQQVESFHSLQNEPERPLFTLEDLNEFAIGSVIKCLGQEYSVYKGRRSLRIPNGDLLLMSRILSIRGRKGELDLSSSIAGEYDVPADAWYFEGQPSGHLPYSICIEVALQPCGVLSAYLGTPLRNSEIDYSFRNLDGEAIFHRQVDARGKTIRARAELLKTIFYDLTIIQHFSFELECDGEVFFEGKSSFGYFSAEAMASQNGLDGRKIVLPWLKDTGKVKGGIAIEGAALETALPCRKLRLLDRVIINLTAGDYQEGYAYACRRNNSKDWFYACHFHEDPVMPGSLGIEAIIQAMRVFCQQLSSKKAAIDLVTEQKMNWSYRGQVLQYHQQMQLEIHFHKIQQHGKTKLFSGDASLWADDSRIYEVKNMVLAAEESQD
jgi:3-hydroxymyristoyl/3-hydroxydecanoyl-(acyl carrier protein) dehydratase